MSVHCSITVFPSLCQVSDASLHQQVVVGSLEGLVQIFQPTNRPGQEAVAEDLLLEQQLNMPVLQMDCGQFMVRQI